MLSTVIAMEDEDRAPIDPRGYHRAYEVVADRIERRIRAGEFTYHAPLPSEPALAEWYGVSRTTVRSAARLLAERGMVEVRPGKGTFVVWQELASLWEASRLTGSICAGRQGLMVPPMPYRRPEINRVSIVPIYEQLEAAIAGQIASGQLQPGEKLPGDHDMANELEIGYQTVRRVMASLVGRGLIERRIGKGTFVAAAAPGHIEGT